jgi:hypothetical protein
MRPEHTPSVFGFRPLGLPLRFRVLNLLGCDGDKDAVFLPPNIYI